MSEEVLDLTQKKRWCGYLKKFPPHLQVIHFMPEYYELFEKRDEGKAQCFVFTKNDHLALYPFLKNSIQKLALVPLKTEYFDIQGAYGYNGWLSSTENPDFINDFTSAFLGFCQTQNIIAEFTRFNPLLENHRFSSYLEIVEVNKNIAVDLRQSIAEIREKSYEQRARKAINKALRSNITVRFFWANEIDDFWLNAFAEIYAKTMLRNDADEFFLFDKHFLENLSRLLSNNAIFFFACRDNKPVSCEVAIFDGKNAYGFLGGTLVEYYRFNPNALLKDTLLMTLKEIGLECYSMGGWQKPYDGIYLYKKSFAKNRERNFYIGKKVHNREIYEKICHAWEKANPQKVEIYKNRLLKYRAK